MRVAVLLEVTDAAVGVLTLSSPTRLNALTGPDVVELGDMFRSAEIRSLRGLVVRGDGRGFSAGADLEGLVELRAMSHAERVDTLRVWFAATRELIRFPAPTVALVHGACVGMAASVALACDRVVTTNSAKWGFVFTAIGLPGSDTLCHWLLSRRIGTRRTWSLLSEAATISGQEAAAIGIADSCAEHLPSVSDLSWPHTDRSAVYETKSHILELEGAYGPLDDQIERILPAVATAVGSPALGERVAPAR
jgi:enoyl-CoA hydratase/carnithine racemase